MGVPMYLFPSTVAAYKAARPPLGPDPFPNPQDEREEVVHQLWQLSIGVAGWWLEETSYLRDLLQKYLVTQAAEAVALEKAAVLRAKRKRDGPRQEQLAAALKDVLDFHKSRKAGRRRVYAGSGTEALS
jgi:hypothetical protein